MINYRLILRHQYVVGQRREPGTIAAKLLAPVEGFGRGRQHFHNDLRIDQHIFGLAVELHSATDDDEIRVGVEAFARVGTIRATAHFRVFAEDLTV